MEGRAPQGISRFISSFPASVPVPRQAPRFSPAPHCPSSCQARQAHHRTIPASTSGKRYRKGPAGTASTDGLLPAYCKVTRTSTRYLSRLTEGGTPHRTSPHRLPLSLVGLLLTRRPFVPSLSPSSSSSTSPTTSSPDVTRHHDNPQVASSQ